MAKRRVKLRHRALAALDLPQEILGDLPKITLVGDQALVENHEGIYEYGQDTVRLHTKRGLLHISGAGLVLRELGPGRVYVEGRIDALEFEGRG